MLGHNIGISNVLNSISKVLGLANKAIPLYKEIKPMTSNIKKVLNIVKEFNKNTKSNNISNIKKVENKKIVNHTSQSNPVFFL